ncbi:MAG: hypothetical protein HGB21_05305 [Nitrospirae bacterium]|nr:hypothetical protein [Nitrospirota bacterium]NTW65721.1 hypothetical protein [Nitrospirota bacterium]
MLRTFLLSLLMTGVLGAGLAAAEIKEVELIDGSVITGEVLSLSSGVYTIRTVSLGTLTIDDAKVRAIRPQSSSSPSLRAGDVKTLQDKMLSNAEVMGLIASLKDDPQFKKALEDPEILNAVSTGDIASLMANPKFLELLNNATVQDIRHKVAK